MVRGGPALLARRFLFVYARCAWHSFKERPTHGHTPARRGLQESKAMGDGAQRAVAILAPGHCAVKYQRADAAKEPVRSFFSCEPAGTMHVKCEWYVARTDHGYVAQARASGAKDPLEGRQQRRKRRTIIMCARRKEATAPDAVRRSGTHSASPLEF